jgi:hypothetical protein
MGHGVELITFGDCEILFQLDGSPVVTRHGDSGGLAELEGRTIAHARQLLTADPGISEEDLVAALRPQLIENRKKMNKPGGYWILSLDTDVVPYAHMRILPAGRMTLALVSDGFLRLRDLFALISDEDLLAIDSSTDFDRFYDQLRALEDADASMSCFPRVKRRDDASLVKAAIHTNGDPAR